MLDRDLGSNAFTPEQQRYHRDFTILLQGQPRQVNIDGKPYEGVPSLLMDTKSSNFFLGVSLPEKGASYNSLWGAYPEVIHGWRALKLLENLPEVDNTILYATWEVSRRESPEIPYQMGKISHLFGSLEQLTTLRDGLMQAGPSPEQLQGMLTRAHKGGVRVEGWELKREAEAGIVTITPPIQELISYAEARSAEATAKFDRIKAEMAIPLPDEESLSRLLQQLEIGSVVVGIPFGGYGIDWDFTPAEKVDNNLRHSSYWGSSGYSLWHSTEVPTFKREQLSPGVTMTTLSAGEIVKLVWTDESTGVKVNFDEARFSEGRIYLKVLLERPNSEKEEAEYTVPQFREKFELPL